ncbi:hypothetical protein F4827_005795 [Paraburkholderia bannensis]|uniref:Lipoprotein n=1 Tax=Paraburkholderia bannensis TaxID=765414 RepID=A0A7W9U4U0_9BURK|nr:MULTISPECIES: hypothetical protein [Paraburkholderia]MBB3260888.1 hypothetical protein [Paraburkholderia sp. WP4_3_2]MBB6105925.1 hypothetical protein [Paraburkholderia bannensis]
MKYVQCAALVASIGLVTLTTGCATVTGGTTQNVSVKTQKDSVDVTGADCVLANSEGTYKVVTPGKVKVHRGKDDLSVHCTKGGEEPALTSVQSSTRAGAVVGDVAWLGLLTPITLGIDRANGGLFAYPDDITVSFGKPVTPSIAHDAETTAPTSTPKVQPDSTAATDTPSTLAR